MVGALVATIFFPVPFRGFGQFFCGIADGQDFRSVAEAAAQFGPKLRPTIEGAAKEKEGVFAHLLMLVAQIAINHLGATAHPVFVALCSFNNVQVRLRSYDASSLSSARNGSLLRRKLP